MNAQQRRRLKRIRQRQKESEERRLNRGDRQFVIAHTPKASRVCVMTADQARRFEDVNAGYRCTAVTHQHYTARHVDKLVADGVVVRIGKFGKIAAWIREVHWETRDGAMQLLPGTYSKRGADQDVQRMPNPSLYRAGAVAMVNDGRIE